MGFAGFKPGAMARRLAWLLMVCCAGQALAADNSTDKAKTVPLHRPAARQAPATEPGFAVTKAPTWVQTLPLESVPAGLPAAPVHVLLADRQLRLDPAGPGVHRYLRIVRQVNETAGLEGASRVEVEFDPSIQKLQWHTLALWRNGQRIDKLEPGKIKLLHREQQLERQMLDGRLTATLILDDLRVGDRVEFAYSLVGDNPVFGGRFADIDWTLSSLGPMALYRYRLLAPTARNIRHQVGDAAVEVSSETRGEQRETVFRRRLAPQFRFDPNAPGGVYLKDQIQLSEFGSWADVGRWAEGLFATASQAGATLSGRAAELRGRSDDPAERLRLALDLVQTEVRYFGTEIGPYTHQPAAAEKVLTQRFGDCKDKVALLATLLGALDLRATPMLVSQRYRDDVKTMLPSPLAFDHAVASVQLGSQALLLDGTRSFQRGPAVERQAYDLGQGLPARAEASLQALPSGAATLRAESQDLFSVNGFAADVALETRQTFYGDLAETVRAMKAAVPAEEFSRLVTTEYLRTYTSAQLEGNSRVDEVEGHNAITVVQRMRLNDPWRFPEQRQLVTDLAFPNLMNVLRLPDQNPRQQPLRLALPGLYRQSVEHRFNEPVFPRPGANRVDDNNPFFELHLQRDFGNDSHRLQAELRLPSDRIEAADWQKYRDQLVKSWPKLSAVVVVPPITLAQGEALRAKVTTLEDNIKRGRVKASTGEQVSAQFRVLLLEEQLRAGRLPPKLRAEALVARGSQLDHLGRLDEARADLEQALALDAANNEVRPALAVNALMRRDDAAAIVHADAALARTASDVSTRYTRAYAAYFKGDLAAAREGLQQILGSRTEIERSYAQVWLYAATRQGGGDGLAAIQGFAPQAREPLWPYPVLRWYRGEIDFAALLKAANTDNGQPDKGRLCELYFYAGQKARLDGDARQASDWYQRAIDTGVIEFNEHGMARRELERLKAP